MKEARLYPEDIPPDLCTHILYAFANLRGTSLQPQLTNDVNVDQGEKVWKTKKIAYIKMKFYVFTIILATLSSYYETKRKKS